MRLNFDWSCTCGACPEQYDIYLFGKKVAYFRLRWGHITVSEYDECGSMGERILCEDYGDPYCGSIKYDDEGRVKRMVETAIIKFYADREIKFREGEQTSIDI